MTQRKRRRLGMAERLKTTLVLCAFATLVAGISASWLIIIALTIRSFQ